MPGIDALRQLGLSQGSARGRAIDGNWHGGTKNGGGRRLLALCLFVFARLAAGQSNSNSAAVTLNAALGEALTVAASPSTMYFTLVPGGTATGAPSVSITTSWSLGSYTALNLFGYFSTTTAALTGGGNNIPSSEVLGQLDSGVFNTFTQTEALGPAGAGLDLFSLAVTALNESSNRTDALSLQINLSAQPQLPAGSYTGTLTLQAQAT